MILRGIHGVYALVTDGRVGVQWYTTMSVSCRCHICIMAVSCPYNMCVMSI